MNKYTFSIQKLAYFLIVICLLTYILIVGKNILSPLVFAIIFAFMLKPICGKIEKIIQYRTVAITLTIILSIIPIVLLITFFSMQLVDVAQNMDSITEKLQAGIDKIMSTISAQFGISKKESEAMIDENSSGMMQAPLGFLGTTLSISSNFLINLFLTFIYTFLLLLYRTSLKKFYFMQFGDKVKDGAELVLERIQTVIQKYLYGLLLVIGILGIMNSVGLTLIGIEYAFLWGFLAALLAIIPYIGTVVGGLLPFLYAFATTDNYWQPISVIGLFTIVQILEGNIITPKVVGSSIKINPLAAILSLLVGGAIWGMSGLILALPFVAIIRIVFNQIDFLKPVGLLLSDELFDKDDVFEEKFDKEKFRIFNFFKKKKPV